MIFTGVKYFISPSLSVGRRDELSNFLDANGGSSVPVQDASHVITDTLQFDGEADAPEDVKITTEEWVTRSILHGKQQDPLLFSADRNMIFSGVIACAADLEPCDKEVISAGINALGGLFREGYTRDCSHVLATRPGSDKYKTAMYFKESTRVRIVLPHWFDDCFKLLARVPEDSYEWPDPPMLRLDQKFKKQRLTEATKSFIKTDLLADKPEKDQIQALTAVQADVWRGKKVLLSSSLGLDEGRRSAVEVSIKRAGGVPVDLLDENTDIDDADVFITQHREGDTFVKAIRANKIIGTLSWLFHVHNTRKFSPPQDQLLHFPYNRNAVEGFAQHKITVTNYEGDARRYLKKLIELMGAEFTPQMTSSNTVVIAAFIGGDKTTKAREWNIPIINHKWLEDCFSNWSPIALAQPQYVDFPPAINFGNLVGRRAVEPLTEEDLQDIEKADQEARKASLTTVETVTRKNDVREEESRVTSKHTESSKASRKEAVQQMENEEVNNNKASHSGKADLALKARGSGASPNKPDGKQVRKAKADEADDTLNDEAKPSRPRKAEASRAFGNQNKAESPTTKSLQLTTGKASRLKRRVSSPASLFDDESELIEDKRQSLKKPKKKTVPDARKPGPTSLFDRELTEDDDDLPDTITISPKLSRQAGKEKQKKERVPEEGENVDPTSAEKVGPPRGAKKNMPTSSPQTSRPLKATVTVEIPISPYKRPAAMNRTQSLVAVASDGPAAHSSPKRGRPKTRVATKETTDEDDAQPVAPPVVERTPLRRSAAAKATARLHEIAPDMLKFEQELRTGRVRNSWEDKKGKGKESAPEEQNGGRKRRVSLASRDEPEQAEDEVDKRGNKKRKVELTKNERNKSIKPDPDGSAQISTAKKITKMKRQTSTASLEDGGSQGSGRASQAKDSGITLMTTKVSLSEDILKGLQNLGVKVTTNPSECTLLVTNSIGRTEKFLCAMATAKAIITEDWAIDSVKAKKIMPPGNYALKDPEGEAKHKITLSESLRRAQSSSRKLLNGHSFYVTKKLQQSDKFTTYKNVIQSAGGKIMTQAPTTRILKAQKDRYLLSLPEDTSAWQGFADEGIRVYVPEVVLTGILAQKMEWGSREHRLDDNP